MIHEGKNFFIWYKKYYIVSHNLRYLIVGVKNQ